MQEETSPKVVKRTRVAANSRIAEARRAKQAAQVDAPAESSSMLTTIVRFLALLALVPGFLAVPYIIIFISEFFLKFPFIIYTIWTAFVLIQLFVFFYWRKTIITINSIGTQNLVWLLFTLGSYSMLNLPQFFPVHLKQISLYSWITLTMFINVGYFFWDDTNYVEEEEKERIKEEKQKKRDQLKKQKEDEETMKTFESSFTRNQRIMINVAFYGFVLGLVMLIAFRTVEWYENYQLIRGGRSVNEDPYYAGQNEDTYTDSSSE